MPTSQKPVAPAGADAEVSHKLDEHRAAVEPPVNPSHREIGGRAGLEPTRYGDWEKNGRCIDF
jgi:hypothetical protein